MTMNKARACVLFLTYASLSTPAFAYLDGATASMLLQAVIGAVATWVMYSKLYAAKAKAFFLRLAAKRQGTDDAQ